MIPVVTQEDHLEGFLTANWIDVDTKISYISEPIGYFGNVSNYS